MGMRALSTALALAAWLVGCAAQQDTSERFYVPKDDGDKWVTVTEGNAGGPPKGSHVVQHFKVALAVKPDAVQGVNVNVDLGAAAWAGHSRVTLDVTWKDVKKVPWKNMDFLLSSRACDDQAVTTPQDVFHPDGKFSYKWPFEPFSKGEGKKKVKKRMQLHMYKNTVLTLAEAQCAVIVDVSSNPPTLLGAAKIRPSKLQIPQQFHSAISTSIRDKGYSFTMYESLDYSCNAVVQEYFSSSWGHTRILFNFGNNDSEARLWLMHAPNATHPKGVCRAQKMEAEVPFENIDGSHVASSRHFLGLRDANTFTPSNSSLPTQVRGVPSDIYSFEINIKRHSQKFTGGYETLFYFSKPIWHVADSFGQRYLRRVELTGAATTANESRTVHHVYDYLDFQPRIPDTVTFEPSFMLPGGDGCEELNLGCAVDKGRKDDAGRRAVVTMVTERVQVDVERTATCTTDAFVKESAHKATVGATVALTCLATAFIVALVTCFCIRRRRDKAVSAAMYAHSASDPSMDS